MPDYDTLYPEVPQTPSDVGRGENFRLHKVNAVLSQLGHERVHYEKVRKKYARWRTFFHNSSVATGSVSVIFTGTGVATSLTGPGIVVGIPLSGIGGFLSLVSASFAVVSKKLNKKISKHEKTIQLVKSKENTISDLVSKALHNNAIDEREFELIMSELQKYESLKNSIRHVQKNTLSPDLQKLREEIKKELVQELAKK